ncbi:HET-domain-containing protein [Hypoxylon sp. NC1633]|nr:HET-domain-containing protein [Hypoxylon sp. NC1633]
MTKTIDRTLRKIRLIKILPDPDDQLVRCELHIQSLTSGVKVTKDILVDNQHFPATANLASALWHFRKYGSTNEQTGEIKWLWVDAVCINQNDIPEKNHQVAMMGSIYHEASSVLSWLGPPGPDRVDEALGIIREAGPILDSPRASLQDTMNAVDKLVEKLGSSGYGMSVAKWELLWNLTRRDYWGRAWIVQEMALAKSPCAHWIICGRESVTMKVLDAFDRLVFDVFQNPTSASGFDPSTEQYNTWYMIAHSSFYISSLGLIRSYQMKAPYTIISAACFSATIVEARDPRDLVYAMLGLISNDISPDYRKSVQDVYLEVIGSGSELNSNVNFAGRGLDAPNKLTESEYTYKLPSWLPDLPKIRSSGPTFFRIGPALVLGTQGTQVEITGQGALRIQGVACSRVKQVKQLDFNRRPLRELFDVLDWHTKNQREEVGSFSKSHGLRMSEVSWCYFVLCLLRQSHVSDAEKDAAMDLDEVLGPSLVDQLLDRSLRPILGLFLGQFFDDMPKYLDNQERNDFIDPGEHLDLLKTLSYSVGQAIFQTDKGQLGIGPRHLQPGDVVCAVHHATLPILLRRVESSNSNGSHWEHIGSYYVTGLSDGEPAGMVERGELEVETFEIY